MQAEILLMWTNYPNMPTGGTKTHCAFRFH